MSQEPNDQLLQSLSALVDDEASELEVRRLLKLADSRPEVMEKWERYNLIGSLMRQERDVSVANSQPSFVSSVSALVNDEPDNSLHQSRGSEENKTRKFKAWELVGKTSIAASFAAALVFSINLFSDRPAEMEGVIAAERPNDLPMQSVAAEVPQGFSVPILEGRTVSQSSYSNNYFNDSRRLTVVPQQSDDLTDVATQDMLNDMLIYHAERASVNGGLGMMPYARVSKMNQPDK